MKCICCEVENGHDEMNCTDKLIDLYEAMLTARQEWLDAVKNFEDCNYDPEDFVKEDRDKARKAYGKALRDYIMAAASMTSKTY